MELNLGIKQTLSLTPQVIQSMEILQMGSQELLEYIDKTYQENPVLEIDDSKKDQRDLDVLWQKLDWFDRFPKTNYWDFLTVPNEDASFIGSNSVAHEDGETLCSYMLSQLDGLKLPAEYNRIAAYLIQSMDKNGYLDEDVDIIAERIRQPEEAVAAALRAVQSLEPAGACARSLSECLILQLDRKGISGVPKLICEKHLDALSKNRYAYMSKALGVDPVEVYEAANVIRTLEPRPGNAFDTGESVQYITPDLLVLSYSDRFEVAVNDDYLPRLYVNSYYKTLLRNTKDPMVREYLVGKLRQAKWLVQSIEQRRSTLLSCSEEIVKIQDEFFKNGKGNLKPMSLSDIAELVNVHESTVSRAIKGKYLLCTYGAYPLSYFFSRALTNGRASDGNLISPDSAKALLKKIISSEDKKRPYSDQKISQLMAEDGTNISRRTVAKYRDELNIPSTVGRRQYD